MCHHERKDICIQLYEVDFKAVFGEDVCILCNINAPVAVGYSNYDVNFIQCDFGHYGNIIDAKYIVS